MHALWHPLAALSLALAALLAGHAQPVRQIARFAVDDSPVVGLALSPDGGEIAYAGPGGVHILDAKSGAARAVIPDIGGLIQSRGQGVIAFSPDGATLILPPQRQSGSAFLSLWAARTGVKQREIERLSGQEAGAAMFSMAANGKTIAAAANGDGARAIRLFTLPGFQPETVINVSYVLQLALSADGATLAVASATDRLDFYASASAKPEGTLALPVNGWTEPLSALAYSPNGAALAAGFANGGHVELPSPDGTLRTAPNPFPTAPVLLWHVAHGVPQGAPSTLCGPQPDGVANMLWLPDQRGLVITDERGGAKLCPLNGDPAQSISPDIGDAVAIPALAADGHGLAIAVNGKIDVYVLKLNEK